jgi:signal transduction histidine kinase
MLQVVGAACARAKPNSSESVHLVSRFVIEGRGIVWLEQWQTIYFDSFNRPAFAIGCFANVTELRTAEQERDQLIYCIIHDLRNPLTILKGFLGVLDMELDESSRTPEVLHILQRMTKACDKLSGMTEDILQLRRFGTAEQQLRESLQLADFITEREEDYRMLFIQKEQTLQLDIPGDLPKLNVVPKMLEELLENLLSNAHKYTPRGGRVTLRARLGLPGTLHIEVEDSGVGIPESELPRLFQHFSRTSAKPTEGEKSHGLGLNICRRIMEFHQGSIECRSTLGVGTTFVCTFPVLNTNCPPNQETSNP